MPGLPIHFFFGLSDKIVYRWQITAKPSAQLVKTVITIKLLCCCFVVVLLLFLLFPCAMLFVPYFLDANKPRTDFTRKQPAKRKEIDLSSILLNYSHNGKCPCINGLTAVQWFLLFSTGCSLAAFVEMVFVFMLGKWREWSPSCYDFSFALLFKR